MTVETVSLRVTEGKARVTVAPNVRGKSTMQAATQRRWRKRERTSILAPRLGAGPNSACVSGEGEVIGETRRSQRRFGERLLPTHRGTVPDARPRVKPPILPRREPGSPAKRAGEVALVGEPRLERDRRQRKRRLLEHPPRPLHAQPPDELSDRFPSEPPECPRQVDGGRPDPLGDRADRE